MQTKGDMEAARRFSPIPFVHRVRRDADGSEDCGSGGVALNFLRLLAGCGSVFLSTGFVGRTIQTRRNFAAGPYWPRKLFLWGGYVGLFTRTTCNLSETDGYLNISSGKVQGQNSSHMARFSADSSNTKQ